MRCERGLETSFFTSEEPDAADREEEVWYADESDGRGRDGEHVLDEVGAAATALARVACGFEGRDKDAVAMESRDRTRSKG